MVCELRIQTTFEFFVYNLNIEIFIWGVKVWNKDEFFYEFIKLIIGYFHHSAGQGEYYNEPKAIS